MFNKICVFIYKTVDLLYSGVSRVPKEFESYYKGSVLEEVLQSNWMCVSSNVDKNHLEGDGK